MPVRERAADHLDGELVDWAVKAGLPPGQVDGDAGDRVFVRLVDSVDWTRVMHEAVACHMAHQDQDSAHLGPYDPDVVPCGDCVRLALLKTSTHVVDWLDGCECPACQIMT